MIFRRRILLDSTPPPSFNFDDVDVMYTLRKPEFTTEWTKAVIRLRRSSDNDFKYVFFDDNGKISLNSETSNISDTPTATTLGTWIGGNDAYVNNWIGLTPNDTIDPNKSAGQGNNSSQPQFISSGSILTKNGEPTIDFLSDTRYLDGVANSVLDSGETFTVFSVSNNNTNLVNGTVYNTTDTDINRISVFNDRRSNKAMAVLNTGTPVVLQYINQIDSANQRLQTLVVDSLLITGYNDGVLEDLDIWSGTYTNDMFRIGAQQSTTNPLNGTIQEIIIYPTDKTANLNEINTNINDYYNIY